MSEEDGQATYRRRAEQRRIGDRPHYEGITRGTVIEYDDWQWAVVTEIDEDCDPAKVGFVLLDELDDSVTEGLEAAWGCAEHYDAVSVFRSGEHEYWTDIGYVVEDDIWSVRGPVHPDERDDNPELVTDGGEDSGRGTHRCPECGRQVTRGPSGVEYGHERGIGETGQTERCSRRPDCVDPGRDARQHDGWTLQGGETVDERV